MDQNEQIIKEQIENAPPEIRKFLADDIWRTTVADIAQKNNLSDEQAVSLENEVLFVLLAMELKTDLQKNISRGVGLSKEIANSITEELNSRVFGEITEWLPTEFEEDVVPNKPQTLDQAELVGATDVLPAHNLPYDATVEEKINPLVGTPGEKISWEQRKQQVADKIVSDNKYGENDPYREPIQ
jgi:hypothetical protein